MSRGIQLKKRRRASHGCTCCAPHPGTIGQSFPSHMQQAAAWFEGGVSNGSLPSIQPTLCTAVPTTRTPGLMAASVWMTSWMGRPVLPLLISRPVPLITPAARVWLGDTFNQPYGAIHAHPQLPSMRP